MTTPASPPGVIYDTRHAAAYERKIRELIPGYELLHTLSAQLLASLLPETANILVAGSGTGEEITRLGTQMPCWRFTAVEPAEAMNTLALAHWSSKGLADRITLLPDRLGEEKTTELHDAALALLVMHFVPDDGGKAQFLKALASRLKAGGVCLLADLTGAPGEPVFEQGMRVWMGQQQASGRAVERVAEDFARLRDSVFPVSEPRLSALARGAGLGLVGCYWQALNLRAFQLRKLT
ncbi:class I SAM-dependent methyltransferase [Chitinimonas sp. BJYL2]|uniref:class I SAM-dependent methyltransferase n=1 Tax=Chitinimonas sp. BJYL2 TaxID=2976696 RepID=UPI0022B35310|nr:class I SAM-dependent methyltransferase [Chitinimonas sp. BJYL2]